MTKGYRPFATPIEQHVAFDEDAAPFANIPVELYGFGSVCRSDRVKGKCYPRDVTTNMCFKIANLIVEPHLRLLHILPMFAPTLAGKFGRLWIRVFNPARIGCEERVCRREIKLLAGMFVLADRLLDRHAAVFLHRCAQIC